MSLSIGVVTIEYLDYPGDLVDSFMRSLMENPNAGLDGMDSDENDFWDGDGGFGNAFYEFEKGGLINRANGWATEQNLSYTDRVGLLRDIENLPYDPRYGSQTIMLHLSV